MKEVLKWIGKSMPWIFTSGDCFGDDGYGNFTKWTVTSPHKPLEGLTWKGLTFENRKP